MEAIRSAGGLTSGAKSPDSSLLSLSHLDETQTRRVVKDSGSDTSPENWHPASNAVLITRAPPHTRPKAPALLDTLPVLPEIESPKPPPSSKFKLLDPRKLAPQKDLLLAIRNAGGAIKKKSNASGDVPDISNYCADGTSMFREISSSLMNSAARTSSFTASHETESGCGLPVSIPLPPAHYAAVPVVPTSFSVDRSSTDTQNLDAHGARDELLAAVRLAGRTKSVRQVQHLERNQKDPEDCGTHPLHCRSKELADEISQLPPPVELKLAPVVSVPEPASSAAVAELSTAAAAVINVDSDEHRMNRWEDKTADTEAQESHVATGCRRGRCQYCDDPLNNVASRQDGATEGDATMEHAANQTPCCNCQHQSATARASAISGCCRLTDDLTPSRSEMAWANLDHISRVNASERYRRTCLLPPLPGQSAHSRLSTAVTDIVIKDVDQSGRFITIENTACNDEEIGCCTLQQKYRGHVVVVFRFPPRCSLPSLNTITVWSGRHRPKCDRGSNIDFFFRELQCWGTGFDYTTMFCRPNGQIVAWTGGTSSSCGPDINQDEICGHPMPPIMLIKNSMPWRCNSHKSGGVSCCHAMNANRFYPRVITSSGADGKPLCGNIYMGPRSCNRFSELMNG